MARGRKPLEARLATVRFALRHLDDPLALSSSPVSEMYAVRTCAERLFPRRTCSRGLAASFLLHRVVRQIAADLGDTRPIGALASALDEGRTQARAAQRLGISEEHLTRRWKPLLVRLVLDHLEQLNRELADLPAIAV